MIGALLFGGALASLLARLILRDRVLVSEWNFLLPVFVPLLAGIAGSLVLPMRPIGRVAGILFATTLSLVALTQEQPNLLRRARPAEAASGGYSLLLWNVMSYNKGGSGVAEALGKESADFVCLLEGTYRHGPPDFVQKRLGRGYHWAGTRQMLVGSKHRIVESRELPCETALRVFRVEVSTAQGPLTILLVDMPRAPRLATAKLFDELWAILQGEEGPCILAGDLNTPRRSWHLEAATVGWSDALLATDSPRWLGTWPSRMPYFQIDHVFSRAVSIASARIGDGRHSDHRPVIVRFRFEE